MSAVPTRRLFDPNRKTQLEYTPANRTSVADTWAKWRAEHAKPTTDESYQRDAIAEQDSYLIPLLTASIEEARAKRAANKK